MDTRTRKTTTATTINDLVQASIEVVAASEKISLLAEHWEKDEFGVSDGNLFSAEYKAAYLKRFDGKTSEQAVSATSSAMTTIRLAMWRASKRVFIKRGKKLIPWEPSKALLKARNLLPADDTPPPAATTPAATTPAVQSSQANITKVVALESLNKVIAFCNVKKLKVNGQDASKLLTAIARAINDEDK